MPRTVEVVERIIIPDVPEIELRSEDGIPLESNWHRIQINLLVESVRQHWHGRSDFFAGGNMFIYYSLRQVRNRDYKGPGFFVVKNVEGGDRRAWIVWNEAMTRLAEIDARKNRVAELRVFGGLTNAEVAEALGISEITVKREWKFALAWLRRELESERTHEP